MNTVQSPGDGPRDQTAARNWLDYVAEERPDDDGLIVWARDPEYPYFVVEAVGFATTRAAAFAKAQEHARALGLTLTPHGMRIVNTHPRPLRLAGGGFERRYGIARLEVGDYVIPVKPSSVAFTVGDEVARLHRYERDDGSQAWEVYALNGDDPKWLFRIPGFGLAINEGWWDLEHTHGGYLVRRPVDGRPGQRVPHREEWDGADWIHMGGPFATRRDAIAYVVAE